MAMTSSDPAITGVVYKEAGGRYVVIVANLGEKPAKAKLSLDGAVLGMNGSYAVQRIDSGTGKASPDGKSRGALTTSELPQWGIEGFVLTKGK